MALQETYVYVGQESGRPWGTKAEGFGEAPHLDQQDAGIDLAGIIVVTGTATETLVITTTLVANDWVDAQLRLGTPAVPLAGFGRITANAANTVTVVWDTAAAAGTVPGYLVRRKTTAPDDDQEVYPQVRVLVPFQPEGPDVASNAVAFPADADLAGSPGPGFVIPSTITKFEDWGLFLEFSFLEGIASFGISEATDSRSSPGAHRVLHVAGTYLAHANAIAAGLLDGGYLRVVDAGTAGSPVSWARILTNDGSGNINIAGWEKGITPVGAVDSITFEAWIPHYNNSPHAYAPGVGFRYPTNDMMPAAFGDGRIKNLPRGITTSSYGDRFGDMLEFAYRMSQKRGKTINIVYLAVNNTTLIARATPNTVDSFLGTLGWWDHTIDSDWAISKTGGIVDRAEKMLKTIAPAALVAEGSTDTIRYMGIVVNMGDGDAVMVAGQQEFAENLETFVFKIRDIINDASLSPYNDQAKIPVVVPLLTEDPFELAPNDEGELVNGSIRERMAVDGFGVTVDPKDSEKLSGDTTHFNGVGEAKNGKLMADALDAVIDYALTFGSAIVEVEGVQDDIGICNLALSHIGEKTITSLDTAVDTSQQARLCSIFYPRARDAMLQSRQWSFTLRRVSMVKNTLITVPSSWLFAYYVPPEAQNPFTVLPEGAIGDFSTRFAGRGTATGVAGFTTFPGVPFFDNQFQGPPTGTYLVSEYSIESDEAGNRVLYTNEDNAQLRYVNKLVDANRYSDLFIMALSYSLASMLAGPVIKGRQGLAISREQLQLANVFMGQAASNDAEHRKADPEHVVSWISAR